MTAPVITVDHGWVNEELSLRAWMAWGILLRQEQRAKEAEYAFRRAITVPITDPASTWRLSEAYRQLGLTLRDQNRLTEALPYLAEAVNLNPRSTWAHIHYGKVLYLADPLQVQQTDQAFTTALTLDPRPEIWQNLIEYWQWVQNKERAQQLCRTAVQHGIVIDNIEACK
jgi:tetratricopeptide (TPR) repeat protein